jgi:hypothetical protein
VLLKVGIADVVNVVEAQEVGGEQALPERRCRIAADAAGIHHVGDS